MSGKAAAEKFKKSVVKLYSSLLRDGRRWPVNPQRRRRSLHAAIPFIVRERFRSSQNETDPEKIRVLAKQGAEELLAMKRIMSNQHMRAYPLVKTFMPKVQEKADQVLSDENQDRIEKKSWGATFRLMRYILGKPQDADPADAHANIKPGRRATSTATPAEPQQQSDTKASSTKEATPKK